MVTTLMAESTDLFKNSVYNAFVKIVNKMTDKELISNREGIELIKELGIQDDPQIFDVTLKKNVYSIYGKFKDLFDEIEVACQWWRSF